VVLSLLVLAAATYGGTRLFGDDSRAVAAADADLPRTPRDVPTVTAVAGASATPPATATTTTVAAIERPLRHVTTIHGDIAPKSVVATGHGFVVANNMMYRHTMTVYDAAGTLVGTISDSVDLASFGYDGHPGLSRGAPVEGAMSADRKHYYVTNYSMFGEGFAPEGSDTCRSPAGLSPSFVYRVDIATLRIDAVAQVGMVPKHVAVSPDGRWVLVANWCSHDLSIIDSATFEEVRRVRVGLWPRGIAVDPESKFAYVGVMSTADVARVDLDDWKVDWIRGVGLAPRHLVLDRSGRHLFVTLNEDDRIAKVDTRTGKVLVRSSTGKRPRSMAIAPDGSALYVVNYESNTVTTVRTTDLAVVHTATTPTHPIGIAFEPTSNRVFVACYSGSILVFDA
jgi:YVTN family beta-propeller protein